MPKLNEKGASLKNAFVKHFFHVRECSARQCSWNFFCFPHFSDYYNSADCRTKVHMADKNLTHFFLHTQNCIVNCWYESGESHCLCVRDALEFQLFAFAFGTSFFVVVSMKQTQVPMIFIAINVHLNEINLNQLSVFLFGVERNTTKLL